MGFHYSAYRDKVTWDGYVHCPECGKTAYLAGYQEDDLCPGCMGPSLREFTLAQAYCGERASHSEAPGYNRNESKMRHFYVQIQRWLRNIVERWL
jgi:hypothetical protein